MGYLAHPKVEKVTVCERCEWGPSQGQGRYGRGIGCLRWVACLDDVPRLFRSYVVCQLNPLLLGVTIRRASRPVKRRLGAVDQGGRLS